ncbi:VOC family protein [Bradyrhizobium elkanii]|uniref:VOC family protein n=1 Tax=Bradyrhizobium elkanii TaxID=29448 RepID=UPI0004B31811|nr:glyoxalase/bleomycin resistance/dioxygenase family protein [Bradyrhizobium elkanii]WLA79505.1 glyoxalase/bleomycin resistance/dioxygenase family protein [Bradyrhizobium elkanii]
MRILQQAFRLYVDPGAFETTIAFYEQAQGIKCERRVKIAETGIEAAKIGGFLIFAGTREKLSPVQHVDGIFYVDSLDEFTSWLRDCGAEIVTGPHSVTGGKNLTARHPDGLVVEYFEAANRAP